jgi:hypothetical protein
VSDVTQHSVPCILTQENVMIAWAFAVTWLIVLKKWDVSQLDQNRRWMATILREGVDMCECMRVSCNMVWQNQSTKLLTVVVHEFNYYFSIQCCISIYLSMIFCYILEFSIPVCKVLQRQW